MATGSRPWPGSGAAGPGAGYLTGAKRRDLPQTMAAQRLPNMLRLGWAELLVDGKGPMEGSCGAAAIAAVQAAMCESVKGACLLG
jgi:hypothetical protein